MAHTTDTDTLTADEAAFVADLQTFYRRAGRDESWKLLDKMNADSENGCYREDHRRTVQAALSKLSTVH